MEQNPSQEANSYSSSQEIVFYGTWRFITMFMSTWLVPIQSQMQPVHTFPPYFWKILS